MQSKIFQILLIEDNPGDARLIYENLTDLENFSFEMEHVDSLEKGTQELKKKDYDVVLLDLSLPDSHGIQTLNRFLKADESAPVVILSGTEDEDLAVSAVKDGAQDYLVKGKHDQHLLGRAIRYAIERKEIDQKLRLTQKELQTTLKQLKEKQNKLLEMEKLKSVQELAGAIAHEFSQPLQTISAILYLIEKDGVNADHIQECHKMISRISKLNFKLRNITTLEKKEYLDGQIIDLDNTDKKSNKKLSRRILVVDDEPEITDPIVKSFEIAGYECDGTYNGKDALELIKTNDYGIIISDISMPEMTGIELFKKFRNSNSNAAFIFLTGYEVSAENKDIITKADAIINKPIVFKDLLDLISKILGNKLSNDAAGINKSKNKDKTKNLASQSSTVNSQYNEWY